MKRVAVAAVVLVTIAVGGGMLIHGLLDQRVARQFRIAAADYIHAQPQLLEVEDRLAPQKLKRLVRAFGGQLVGNLEGIRFAELCELEPVSAAHLIIDGRRGPISLMYSSKANLKQPVAFEVHQMQGIHYPVDNGSVAMFGEKSEPLDAMINKVGAAISW